MAQEKPEEPENGATPAPLLDLDTLIVRPEIAIDGVRYAILSPSEISVIESHRFGKWGKRIEELGTSQAEEAEQELAAVIGRVARAVALVGQEGGIPDVIFANLSGSHKWAIVDVFTGLLLHQRLSVAGAIAKAAGLPWSTGETSSPGSSGSMAAVRRGGWLRRLWRW